MHRNDRLIIMLGIAVVLIALIGAAVGGQPKTEDMVGDEEEDFANWPIRDSESRHINGNLNENSHETVTILLNESYITKVKITLNWLDEAPLTIRHENEPDSFNFTILTPWGETIESIEVANEPGQAGIIAEEKIIPEDGIKDNAAQGEWKVTIYCGDCGDQVLKRPSVGLFDQPDTGNDWSLSYTYSFHTNTAPQ